MRGLIPIILSILLSATPAVVAETIWDWTHQASGSGTANVFDGGPPRTDSGDTVVLDNPWMTFSAYDLTRPGTMGARAYGSGGSIISTRGDEMTLRVDLTAAYFPSSFGGDNPGGTAEGSIFSVIEFVVPAGDVIWFHHLVIDERAPFEGSTRIVVENTTRSEILETLTSHMVSTPGPPLGAMGDVIRVTSMMEGIGTTGPASGKYYMSDLRLTFRVPEPGTPFLFGLVLLILITRRRRGSVITGG